jgi:hypothetical protein
VADIRRTDPGSLHADMRHVMAELDRLTRAVQTAQDTMNQLLLANAESRGVTAMRLQIEEERRRANLALEIRVQDLEKNFAGQSGTAAFLWKFIPAVLAVSSVLFNILRH